MQPIHFPTLDFGLKIALCWSFFWRGVVITLGSMIAGGLLGFVLGFVLALVGVSRGAVTAVGGLSGIVCGFGAFYFYVRWLLSSKLGAFRLQLVKAA